MELLSKLDWICLHKYLKLFIPTYICTLVPEEKYCPSNRFDWIFHNKKNARIIVETTEYTLANSPPFCTLPISHQLQLQFHTRSVLAKSKLDPVYSIKTPLRGFGKGAIS